MTKHVRDALTSPAPVPLSVPLFDGKEWAYVKECLDTNWVSSAGPFVDRFEQGMARATGTQHAVATVNGTAALHAALLLAGVGEGDEVVVSDLTFIAPANAVRYVGAHPVFVDADPVYWQMDVEKLKDFLERGCKATGHGLRNTSTGRKVKALLPVHILGGVCDMKAILEMGCRFGLPVIEDASECLGATTTEGTAGSVGLVGCFSFNGNKILTTGGGGMLVTNNEALAMRARYLTTQAKDDPLEFIHHEVGYNYRLPSVLAAIGCAQLEQLERFVARKRAIAAKYTDAISRLSGVTAIGEAPGTVNTFWLYTIRVDRSLAGFESRDLMSELGAEGVQSRPLWQPMHLSRAHRGAFATDCSVAERLNKECLSLPCSVGLTEPQQDLVISVLGRCAKQTSGKIDS